MKKQIIAAVIATSVSAAALADISITGNAKYEYFNSQVGTAASTNKANTEVNLGFKGKTGDTTVVLNMEFNSSGDVSTTDTDTTAITQVNGQLNEAAQVQGADLAATVENSFVQTLQVTTGTSSANANGARGYLDIEDMYITTKVGDINIKAGNWVSGTSSLGGEIKEDSRSNNKVDMRTTVGGVTIYAGNNFASGNASSTTNARAGSTLFNNNMYAGAVFNVQGNKVEIKKVDEDTDAFGLNGSMGGVDYRLESYNDTATNGDTVFGNITTSQGGFNLGYAWIDADKVGQITQDDSSIFAVEGVATTADGVKQLTVGTTVDGNKVTLKSGSVSKGLSDSTDADFFQVGVSRALASGANAVITYTDKDSAPATSTETLEVELNVSF